jgi:hypothetical protein
MASSRQNKTWLPSEDRLLLSAIKAGLSLDDIADSHERPIEEIKWRARALVADKLGTDITLENLSEYKCLF